MILLRSVLALVVCVLLLSPAAFGQYMGTKVVETGVNYPGIGTITSLPAAGPAIRGSVVAFQAQTPTGQGIFTATGGAFQPIATTATAVPGSVGNFTSFSPIVSLSDAGVAFLGSGPGTTGDYTNVTGSLTRIVDTTTAFPGGGTFTSASVSSLSGTTAVFSGGNAGAPIGVFTKTGTAPITTVVNTSTPVPGGSGNFTVFADPSSGPTAPTVSGSNVAFNGQGGGRFGVYASIGGTVRVVADNATPAPGGVGNFSSFGFTPMIDGSDVTFFGVSSGRPGVYLWSGASPIRVADTSTPVPGGVGNFTTFYTTATPLHGGQVVFAGIDAANHQGVYTYQAGSLQKVVAAGDVLDGHTITAVTISDYSFSGGDIAVTIAYSGGSAIYTFTPVPEPGGLLLAPGATAGLVWARRKWRAVRSRTPA